MSLIGSVNFVVWLTVFVAFSLLGIFLSEKIRRTTFRPQRVRNVVAGIVSFTIICAGIFHPIVVTYPTIPLFGMENRVAAEISPDRSLRRLPFGAIDPLLDGPVVRLGETMRCHFQVEFAFKGSDIGAKVSPGMVWVDAETEDGPFYQAYGIGGGRYTPFLNPTVDMFCGHVREIVHEEFRARISGKELDFNPEISEDAAAKAKGWLESSLAGAIADKATGVYRVRVRLGG